MRTILRAATCTIGLLACVGPAAAQTAQRPAGTGALAGPRSPSGWYSAAEFDSALQATKILGQPLALMYQDTRSTCPKHNGQRDAWLRAPELAFFVRVVVDSGDRQQTELMQKLRQTAGDRAGRFVPMLFFGTSSGELLGVVPCDTPWPQFQATVVESIKLFGGVLPPKTALELWQRLETARTHWKNGKTDAALSCYQVVKRGESKNPKLAIFAELRKDEEQINEQGAKEVAAAQALLQEENQGEARAAIAAIRRRYSGFTPAEDAKKLLETAAAGSRTASPVAAESARRVWSDVSGTYHVEAELVAVKDDSIRLKKAGGDYVNVPIGRLARDDQKYVEQWLAQRRNEQANSDAKTSPQ